MKTSSRNTILSVIAGGMLVSAMTVSCVRKVEKSDKAIEREQWHASLADSIKATEKVISETESQLEFLHEKIGELLTSFSHVDNPREVEGYTILSGWKNRYPLKSTGVAARITEDEGFEIIAALSKGNFDAIEVECGGQSVVSGTVPHDQALNYRLPGLNTVAFTAGKGDTIGSFVSGATGNVTLFYLNGSRRAGSLVLDSDTRRMISDTWELYSSQRQAEKLERTLPLLNSRLQTIRRMADNGSVSGDQDK